MEVKIKTESTYSITIDGVSDRCLTGLIKHLRDINLKDLDVDGRFGEVVQFREVLEESYRKTRGVKIDVSPSCDDECDCRMIFARSEHKFDIYRCTKCGKEERRE